MATDIRVYVYIVAKSDSYTDLIITLLYYIHTIYMYVGLYDPKKAITACSE